MTLQQLTYLVKVAECGNITEAAEQLYISQPSMSTAISNLEKEMGITAFNRTKKRCDRNPRRRRASVLCADAIGTGGYHEGTFRCWRKT